MDTDDALDIGNRLMGEFAHSEADQAIAEKHKPMLEAQYQSVINVGIWAGFPAMMEAVWATLLCVFVQGYKQAQADAVQLDPDVWSE